MATRIVAGQAKGRVLDVPAKGVRPTSNRAREALFNSLTGLVDLAGTHVADIFAGTGAVGLEALSRGAASATFVEADRRVCEVLHRNIAAVGLPGAVVRRGPAATVVASRVPEPYEFAYLDPPYAYESDELARLVSELATHGLGADAIVVVERSIFGQPWAWPDQVTPVKERRYGNSMLWYGRRR